MSEYKFDVIYADPPWKYDFSKSKSRAIENHYPTMALNEICDLFKRDNPCQIADDAVLFLWVPAPKLPEGLEVMRAWGFEYKSCWIWVKDKIGMGYYLRNKHETILLGTKGERTIPEEYGDIVFAARRKKHSAKPRVVYRIIEDMYPDAKRIELFARDKREGWAAWGNEAPSTTQQRIIKAGEK